MRDEIWNLNFWCVLMNGMRFIGLECENGSEMCYLRWVVSLVTLSTTMALGHREHKRTNPNRRQIHSQRQESEGMGRLDVGGTAQWA